VAVASAERVAAVLPAAEVSTLERVRRLAPLIAVLGAALGLATTAHADELESTVFAARKRPLAAVHFPGGPDIKRNIAGVGLEWVDAPPDDKNGWLVRVGAAIEYQADCSWTQPTCPFPSGGGSRLVDMVEYQSTLPDNHVEAGGHARAGYAWGPVQLEAGVLVHSATYAGSYGQQPVPSTGFVPDVVARVGWRRTFVAVGYGSFAASTILAPVFFLQAEAGFAERWSTTLTVGESQLDGYTHDRLDFGMRYRLTKTIRVGEGVALTHARRIDGEPTFGGEARLLAAWIF
jgi:hypothetical protein